MSAAIMKLVTLNEIDILDVGNSIQLGGAIWTGNGKLYLVPLPDEPLDGDIEILRMDASQFERFLNQSDVLDVRGPGKAILRKSQRQIDQWISWRVFKRDAYACRYCGRDDVPLTVDHIILWEEGGASVEDNLLTACRRCNKLRGSMEFSQWLTSAEYNKVSEESEEFGIYSIEYIQRRKNNEQVLDKLGELKKIVAKPRSR
jgi:hypothetical protein